MQNTSLIRASRGHVRCVEGGGAGDERVGSGFDGRSGGFEVDSSIDLDAEFQMKLARERARRAHRSVCEA